MDLPRLFDELVATARRCGIQVRIEAFDPGLSDEKTPRGGLCTVRGKPMILVDSKAPLPDRIAMVAAALSTVDLEHLFLAPIVRATIGAYQHEAPHAKTSKLRRWIASQGASLPKAPRKGKVIAFSKRRAARAKTKNR